MKKTTSVLICVLSALLLFYPAGVVVAACFGDSFRLASVPGYAAAIALAAVCALILSLISECRAEAKAVQVLAAINSPLSLITAVFCLFACTGTGLGSSLLTAWCFVLTAGSCCFLTIRHGRALRIAMLATAAALAVPIGYFSFLLVFWGNLGQDTVVRTVESPNGAYYAELIDSDQGALGGDTLVRVCETGGFDALVFRVEKKPQLVYRGDWGEFEDMELFWRSDECIVINGKAYGIKTP